MLLHGGNVTYRLPKGMQLQSELKEGPHAEGRVYVGPDMRLVVTRGPIQIKRSSNGCIS